ncbi:inactive phospholipase C-like protein 2 isoform X2 [Gigantopelta aegis]|uniref:inactive phospholipase C-like protein 2 isoform X2 n=1 Tax=Gigantopelta aegis TaxID=1735272 RepID=UPI001B88BEE9|nr:inactive phospholipase C-like protein 2 isoform X2 [Gigantopelta aegis]
MSSKKATLQWHKRQSMRRHDPHLSGLKSQDCLAYMQTGSDLIKVRSNSRQYHRFFTLGSDMTEIRWQPTSKKPHKARIAVNTIKEARQGKTTDALRNKEIAGIYPDECAFSIIFGEEFESMDLIANTPDEANIWVTGLTCLINANTKSNCSNAIEEMQQMRNSWLLELFEKADSLNSGVLDENEVVNLMRKINATVTIPVIYQKLKELEIKRGDGKRGRLTSDEFISLFKEISTRPEIYFLLVRYASNADYMSTDDLLLFLEAEQGMQRVTKDKCLEIINNFEPSKEGRRKGQLGIDGFTAYLLSTECDIFDMEHKTVCQDMTQPLNHYFIASSHNTYLLEDQLKGPSSVDGYISALRKGCRCVELDCWDGPNDEPIIYHGHTLTSKISFRSVVEAIKQYAFEVSDYPVIISIENHCNIKQQQVMAACLKEILGDKLCVEPIPENLQCAPSPEDMKSKILIKGKKLPINSDCNEGYVTDEDEGAEPDKKKSNKREGSVKKQKLAKELSDMVNYCVSRRFEDFQISQQHQKFWEMCSFSESQALKLAMSCPEEFVNHNKHFLSRIYPNAMRIDSSNYNPHDLWNCGCQMVALNYQTAGLMMDLYDGWFNKNGGCGYVLKPAIMREEIAYFSANTRDVIPGVSPQILHIKIISGQNFPKPKGSASKGDVTDPYIRIEIFGIPADCAEERTKTMPHNGYNPIFDMSFEFQVNLPELALVRFAVLDDEYIGDEFIGQYTIPFDSMLTGYRHIRLLSNTGTPLSNCTLFVHVSITNKRGGGSSKRGLSKKTKRSRDYTSMKSIGVKSIDETFKVAIQPLREGTDLRDNVQFALSNFKEKCGLSPIANIKQCIRLLATRIHHTVEHVTLTYIMRGDYPSLEAQGTLPEIHKKALLSFDDFINECKVLIETSDLVYEKLLHCQRAGMEWHEELESYCTQAGLRGKKVTKAIENFAWNIRVLKGQADLLQQCKKDCMEYIRQIKEAAVSTGLSKETPDQCNNVEPLSEVKDDVFMPDDVAAVETVCVSSDSSS